MAKRVICTAGYGGTTPTNLVKMLEEASIEYVIDVRRHDSRAYRGYYNPGRRGMGMTLSKFIYRNAIALGNYFQTKHSNGLDEYVASISNPDDNMIMDIAEVAVTCKQYVTCFICCES